MAKLNMEITDSEERALAFLGESKQDVLGALRLVLDAQRTELRRLGPWNAMEPLNDTPVQGVYDSINYEEQTLAGYQRALTNRRLKLSRRGVTR